MSTPTWETVGAARVVNDCEIRHVGVDVSSDGKIILWLGDIALWLTPEAAMALSNALCAAGARGPPQGP